MFNNFLFNNGLFNEIETVGSPATTQDEVSYNGFGLQNQNIIISKMSSSNGHIIESNTFNSPLSDLGGELNYYFRSKIITIDGYLKYSNLEELENGIDNFKKNLSQNGKNLDIKINGNIRRAKVSCINLDNLFNREHYHITFLPFSIQFRLIEEFSYELSRQIQTLLGNTTGFTEEIVNIGTARSNPIFNIVVNTGNPTAFSLIMGDDTITINRTFTAGEVLEINTEEKRIKINGSNIDFDGTFPILKVGNNSYTINFTGTVNFDLNIFYYKNYL